MKVLLALVGLAAYYGGRAIGRWIDRHTRVTYRR